MTHRIKRLGAMLSLLGAATLAVVGASAGLAAARTLPSQASARSQDQLIPLYDNASASDWTQACSQVNGSGGGSWIIADVDAGQGPGSAPVPAYTSAIDNCYSYGRASVIGYVDTDYGEGGQASIASIESEIKAWYSFYPGNIAGIFFEPRLQHRPGDNHE